MNKILVLDTVYKAEEDIESLIFRSVAVETLLQRNPYYEYESGLYYGPPHYLKLKIYKYE